MLRHGPILDALSDPTRRRILELIQARARSVGEVARMLPVSQPAVSQHLRVLREAGLVRADKRGRSRIYHLHAEGLEPLRQYVASFWEGALDAYRASFETPADTEEEGR
jgi:DNA-binding transcriptional ArsR family regulator